LIESKTFVRFFANAIVADRSNADDDDLRRRGQIEPTPGNDQPV
jgi:hypothetical protein